MDVDDDHHHGFVLGTSGGAGTTALATACAVRAAGAGRDVVLVDTHPWGGGIEVMAGLEAQSGLRWADLTELRGDVDPQRLHAELPQGQPGLRCLSWGSRPPVAEPPGPDPVLVALRRAVEVVVVDLPRPAAPRVWHGQWWEACDAVVLVVEPSVVGIGAATVVAAAVEQPIGVVLRSPTGLDDEELATAMGTPVLARVGDDTSVRRCLERGDAVATMPGALADAADEVLAAVLSQRGTG